MSVARRFDWDKARRMRKKGMSYTAIAAELGVSRTAVARVCDTHQRNYMAMQNAAYQRSGICVDCGGQRSFNLTQERNGISKGRCRECANIAKATTVREDSLQCLVCREWKWDTEFAHSKKEPMRRGRHDQCRSCNTEAKRRWRLENPKKARAADARDYQRKKEKQRLAL